MGTSKDTLNVTCTSLWVKVYLSCNSVTLVLMSGFWKNGCFQSAALSIFNKLLEKEHLHECIHPPTWLSIMLCSRNLFLCRSNFHVKINLFYNSPVRCKPLLIIWLLLSPHEIIRVSFLSVFLFLDVKIWLRWVMSFSFKNCESLLACLDENPKLVLEKKLYVWQISRFLYFLRIGLLVAFSLEKWRNFREHPSKMWSRSRSASSHPQLLKIFITLSTELFF